MFAVIRGKKLSKCHQRIIQAFICHHDLRKITVIDSHTAQTVTTERLRYGQRVSVIAFPCDPIWRSPRGLEIAGPRAFGYDFEYVPVEGLHGGT